MCGTKVLSRARAFFSLLAALASGPAVADVINVDALFGASSRSLWTGGAGASIDKSGFLGPDGWSLPPLTIGGIGKECLFGVCVDVGAKIGAESSGKAGIGYGLKLDSGTFDIQYPARFKFDVPSV